ncbi:MAG: hypothetical protein ACPG4T_18970, partial [Nannocystaceae bacterium]
MQDSVALATLVDSAKSGPPVDPGWLLETLQSYWCDFQPAGSRPRTRAWSVGGVHGLETLVQSRPVVRDQRANLIEDFLRVPSQCTLASFAVGRGQQPVPRLAISRFERWIGIQAEGLPPESVELRTQLRGKLPGFLARSLRQGGDRELIMLSFLACLHDICGVGRTYAAPADIRQAMRDLDERLGHPPRFHMVVADGRTTAIFHRGGSLLQLVPERQKSSRQAITGPHTTISQHPTARLLIHDPTAPTTDPATD